MAFNATLSDSLHKQYSGKGIDIIRAVTPYAGFESWLKRGLILEVVMQERILARHVKAVLNHLVQGYSETSGTFEEAFSKNFQLPQLHAITPMTTVHSQFF